MKLNYFTLLRYNQKMNFQVSMNCKKWRRFGEYNKVLLFESNLTLLIGAITVQLPLRAESPGRLKLIHLTALFLLKLCSKKLYKTVNQAKLELWG